MSAFPSKAKVVIVGAGGIVGASVIHHLIENGWEDIVGIDKSGIPTDIGSTAHASDFCYATSHDLLMCWTTMYSMDFYERMGHYARVGGLEVARVVMMNAWQNSSAAWILARLLEPMRQLSVQRKQKRSFRFWKRIRFKVPCGPGCRLVVPRSQTVAGKLIDEGVESGKLQIFANTSALELITEDGRIKGVKTERGTIHAEYVVVCAGLWGRLIAEMAGEDLPVMPVDHPLTFFGPYTAFEGTGTEIGLPLLRDQGNSAICAIRVIRKVPRVGRLNGATTTRRTRGWFIRAIFWRRSRPGFLPPNEIWCWRM